MRIFLSENKVIILSVNQDLKRPYINDGQTVNYQIFIYLCINPIS